MKVVLFKGKGLVSRLIRWQTRSEYSHAALLLEDGTLIESREGKGVQAIANWQRPENAVLFEVKGLQEEWARGAREFLSAQIGKKYDWLMVARFVSRRQEKRSTSGKWFCSELVFAALQKAGVALLR